MHLPERPPFLLVPPLALLLACGSTAGAREPDPLPPPAVAAPALPPAPTGEAEVPGEVAVAEDDPAPAPPDGEGDDPPPLAAPAEPATPPASPEDPAPSPDARPAEGGEAAEAPAKEAPDARPLLREAAARQGTADLAGEKAVRRFRAEFGQVLVYSDDGDKVQTRSVETYALPAPGSRRARVRSEWTADGSKKVLGHSGRVGWMWTEAGGTRLFTDERRDAGDLRDLDQRRRMLGLVLRVFFLGNLASGEAAVTLGPEEERVFPRGDGDRTRKARTKRIDRMALAEEGEPPLRLHLDAGTLDPVAAEIPPGAEGGPGYLLTFEYDPEGMRIRGAEKGAVPEGIRIPTGLELFELPGKGKPRVRIRAEVTGLVVDPSKIPDALFQPPK